MNFKRLVHGCVEAKFCKKIFVGKLLTRSTRFACFCTAQTSIFHNISETFRQTFSHFSAKFCKIYRWSFRKFSLNFAQSLMKFCVGSQKWWNLVGISQIFSKMLKILNSVNFLARCTEFWQNFDRTLMWKVRMVRSLADRTFQLRYVRQAAEDTFLDLSGRGDPLALAALAKCRGERPLAAERSC